MKLQQAALLVLLSLAAWLGVAQADPVLLDDFNRADSTSMGANWTEQWQDFRIESNQARSNDKALMTYVGATSNSISIDVFHNGSTTQVQYCALVLGYQDNNNNLFCKIQDNDVDGGYEFFLFTFGNNGQNAGAWTGGTQIWYPSEFTAARMTASLIGTTVTVDIDTDFDGTAEYTFSRGNVPTALIGSGIGLGGWGDPKMDNFRAQIIPEPLSMAFMGSAFVGVVGWRMRRRRRRRRNA